MNLDSALHEVSAFSAGDRLEGLKQHLPADWIEEALAASGTVTLRRRRLPAEQVVWMVIGNNGDFDVEVSNQPHRTSPARRRR